MQVQTTFTYDEIKASCKMIYFLLLSLNINWLYNNSSKIQYDPGQGHPEDHFSNPMLLLPLSYQPRVTQTAASSSTLHHLHQ